MATPQQIRFCLDRARETLTEYDRYTYPGRQSFKSLDDFVDLCQGPLGKKFKLEEVQIAAPGPIKASYIAYGEVQKISVRTGLPRNWLRLAVCKELFHVLIDKAECRRLDIYEHLGDFLSPTMDDEPNSVTWEWLAGTAAMEFLFPYSDRVVILKNSEETGEPVNYEKLEANYGVPASVIERYLSQSAMEYFSAFRGDDD